MSQIVLYFLHSTSVHAVYIDVDFPFYMSFVIVIIVIVVALLSAQNCIDL